MEGIGIREGKKKGVCKHANSQESTLKLHVVCNWSYLHLLADKMSIALLLVRQGVKMLLDLEPDDRGRGIRQVLREFLSVHSEGTAETDTETEVAIQAQLRNRVTVACSGGGESIPGKGRCTSGWLGQNRR